jgi:hypothetical protein
MGRKIRLGGQSFNEERGVRYGQGGDMTIEQTGRYPLECMGDESNSGKGWKCRIGKDFIENLDGKAELWLNLCSVPRCNRISSDKWDYC